MEEGSGQTTVCDADGAITRVEFTNRFGECVSAVLGLLLHRADISVVVNSVPALQLPMNYESHLTNGADAVGVVIYDGVAGGTTFVHDSVTYTTVQGTKEEDYCAGRGFCDQTKGELATGCVGIAIVPVPRWSPVVFLQACACVILATAAATATVKTGTRVTVVTY